MRNELSGNTARKWRRKVAAFAQYPSDQTRTLKFPLEVPAGVTLDFAALSDLYQTTNGTGPASLFDLLCTTHLCGFRMFGNVEDTKQYRNARDVPDDRFLKQWKIELGCDAGRLSPATLIKLLAKKPRNIGSRVPTFGNKPVGAELYQLVTGKLPVKHDEPVESVLAFFDLYDREMIHAFADRQAVADDVGKALRLFDSVAATLGYDLPSIEAVKSAQREVRPPNSRIAFDPDLLQPQQLQFSDTNIHAVVAQKLALLKSEGGAQDKNAKYGAALKNEILTEGDNALDWLFGSALKYWQTTPLADVIDDFDLPASAEPVAAYLQAAFQSVRPDPVFGAASYKMYRRSVSGMVSSWVSNYLKRLDELHAAIDKMEADWRLPEWLASAENADLLNGLGLNFDQVQQAIDDLLAQRDEVKATLRILSGEAMRLPVEADVEAVEEYGKSISGVTGLLNVLRNRLDQEQKNDHPSLRGKDLFTMPDWSGSLPKINRIAGGVPAIEDDLQNAAIKFHDIQQRVDALEQTLLEWATAHQLLGDPIQYQSDFERSRATSAKLGMSANEALVAARRNYLERLLRIAASGTDPFKTMVKAACRDLVAVPKDLNRRIDNFKGRFYYSPFTSRRHDPYEVISGLQDMDFIGLLNSIESHLKQQRQDERLLRDLLRLQNLKRVYRLNGLPKSVPSSLLDLEQIREDVRLQPSLAVLLEQENVGRDQVLKLITLYNSELMGKVATLFRSSFIVRTKYARIGFNELAYVPKARNWNPPPHVFNSESLLGSALKADFLPPAAQGTYLPVEVFNAAAQAKRWPPARGRSAMACLFSQMPHDWYVDVDLKNMGSPSVPVSGMRVGKKNIIARPAQLNVPCRLVGPSSFKTVLDQWMLSGDISMGEHNLIVEQRYAQSASLTPDGQIKAVFTPKEVSLFLAVAITEPTPVQEGNFPLGETAVGIDLGEAGLGYAVFRTGDLATIPANDLRPIASGTVAIRSVRNLMKNVDRYRKRTQPRQKFQQNYNIALQLLRENATGDIAHAIDNLCWRYKGFPVLESSVRYLASGSQQLKLVYDKVLNLYSYSNIDAHKSIRKEHWAGGEKWVHPVLRKADWSEKDRRYLRDNPLPLNLFPGVQVHPAYTSQICSHCGRNPYKVIDESPLQTFTVSRGGVVTIDDANSLLLMLRENPLHGQAERRREQRAYGRRKEHRPFQYPVAQGVVGKDNLIYLVKAQLRQPQTSTRSRDTSQSVYQCLFVNCGNRMHADENAAINIARKWAERLVL